MRTILLIKAYVVTWTFGKLPLPPDMSTWFMNAPYQISNQGIKTYTYSGPKHMLCKKYIKNFEIHMLHMSHRFQSEIILILALKYNV